MSDYQNQAVDWYLFFDLLQASKDILRLTNNNSILILVGDTPSYLVPFLEKDRQVFHFAFSNKPFGCFLPRYGNPYEWNEELQDVFTPEKNKLHQYFDYLDKETELTRDFVKNHWTNIVLIDSSSGASIHGVSIFFNRYIGNIVEESGQIRCTNIKGSVPLQFIQLADSYYPAVNLEPSLAEKFYPKEDSLIPSIRNYRPDLIIHLGIVVFYHTTQFIIYDAYPRLLPFYSVNIWDVSPDKVDNPSFPMAIKNIKTLKFLLQVYEQRKKVDSETFIEFLEQISLVEPVFEGRTMNELEKFMKDINKKVLLKRFFHYFQ